MTNWIDPDCKFGRGLSLAEKKNILPPPSVMEQGYDCNNKTFNNLNLSSQHTALFGILFELLDTIFENEDAMQCLWDGPFKPLFCAAVNATRAQGIEQGSFSEGDVVTITYPNPINPAPIPVVSPLFNGQTSTAGDAWWQINAASISATGFTATMQVADSAATSTGFTWQAQTDCT